MDSYCDPALRQLEKEESGSPLVATHVLPPFRQQAPMAFNACSEGMKVTLPLHVTLPVLKPLHDERCQVAEIKSKAPAAMPADASTTNTSRGSWCAGGGGSTSTDARQAAHQAHMTYRTHQQR